ncbi:MAG: glycosyltransferase [Candidatus Accumulibacter sp.]|jgi:glycosyltransferase involved in cell wall biosynthesis|nr:glycosyltransferase [Accumulibacter sp.]
MPSCSSARFAPDVNAPQVLQFCHGYDGPFLDCARQYASLFQGAPYRVTTIFLTGAPSEEVTQGCASDEVIFLGFSSAEIRHLKLRAVLALRRISATRRFRFCIAHRFKPIYIALLATRLPVIGVHHAFDDYQRFSRRAFASFFRHRLALLGVSNAVRDNIRAALPAWPQTRIETLYNRIDIEAAQSGLFPRDAARAALDLSADAWIVGNVGRLHPDKDQATLICAFARALPRLPEGSLLAILGSGRMEAALKSLAHELNVEESVRFLGQIPGARRYFKAFDLFALSSDHEPFGMVLLEAMAADVPVLATDCGGAPEVVGNRDQLFPLKDAKTLAERLVGFMTGSEARGRLRACAAQGRQRLALFTDDAARRNFFSLPMIRAIIEAQGR